MENKIKNVIIGAGLSGLSLAYHLEKQDDKDYLLIEANSEVGGLSTSIIKEGFVFDLAPHTLHLRDEGSLELLKDLIGEELVLIKRKAGILLNGRVVPYPFQHNLYHLEKSAKEECLQGAIEASEKFDVTKIPSNFEEWIKISLGEGIAKHFMVPYNKKCYGVHPREMTTDFMGRYIPAPNLEEIKNGTFQDNSELKISYNYQFYYTKSGGIHHLPKAIEKRIQDVNLNEKVIEIDLEDKFIYTNKSAYEYVNLISTIPLKELIKSIKNVPEKIVYANEKLRGNKVGLVLLGINRLNVSPYQWLYLPQKGIFPFRVSFPSNYSQHMAPPNNSSICAEYSYLGENKFNAEEIMEKTINDLIELGIVKGREEIIFKEVVDLGRGFIIFDQNRNESLQEIQNYLRENSVHLIGRFGAWEYSSMEDAILQGKALAEKLLKKN